MPVVKDVIVYGASWCAFCKTEKQWLERLGVTFTYKEIDTDESAMAELVALDVGSSVPVTKIGDEIVRGFQRQLIQSKL